MTRFHTHTRALTLTHPQRSLPGAEFILERSFLE